ncbi:MAG TPA: hypothetical protein VLF15_00090, partial [Pseudoxanthomonas sp.]|nr:hypothetical protein [Pseudoxanthomonas sp.]
MEQHAGLQLAERVGVLHIVWDVFAVACVDQLKRFNRALGMVIMVGGARQFGDILVVEQVGELKTDASLLGACL